MRGAEQDAAGATLIGSCGAQSNQDVSFTFLRFCGLLYKHYEVVRARNRTKWPNPWLNPMLLFLDFFFSSISSEPQT